MACRASSDPPLIRSRARRLQVASEIIWPHLKGLQISHRGGRERGGAAEEGRRGCRRVEEGLWVCGEGEGVAGEDFGQDVEGVWGG